MELKYDRQENLKERINFIHYYVQWIKKTPNEIWSKQQAELIDSFMQNARNFKTSPQKYLEMVERRETRSTR